MIDQVCPTSLTFERSESREKSTSRLPVSVFGPEAAYLHVMSKFLVKSGVSTTYMTCRLSTHTPEYLELVMLRISGVNTFTKYLVKPSVQNGVRLGLLGSTLRAGHHVRRQFPPVFVRNYAQPPGGNGFPGFTMGPQHQKGEALKEYVSHSYPSAK
jgi:hypothetical protein